MVCQMYPAFCLVSGSGMHGIHRIHGADGARRSTAAYGIERPHCQLGNRTGGRRGRPPPQGGAPLSGPEWPAHTSGNARRWHSDGGWNTRGMRPARRVPAGFVGRTDRHCLAWLFGVKSRTHQFGSRGPRPPDHLRHYVPVVAHHRPHRLGRDWARPPGAVDRAQTADASRMLEHLAGMRGACFSAVPPAVTRVVAGEER